MRRGAIGARGGEGLSRESERVEKEKSGTASLGGEMARGKSDSEPEREPVSEQ